MAHPSAIGRRASLSERLRAIWTRTGSDLRRAFGFILSDMADKHP